MKFTLSIDCDGAAFEDDCFAEVVRIMREAAERLEITHAGEPPQFARGFCRDLNGNTVGKWEMLRS